MVTYIEPAKELPVYHYDVVVAGGGTAGVVAAIASARTGAKTALIEAKGYVGGTMLEGGTTLHSFFTLGKYFHRESRQIVKGIAQEIIDRLVAVGGSTGHLEDKLGIDYDEHCTLIDVESVKLVEAEMLEEAGVDIWFNTLVAGADVENGHIRGMIAQSRVEGRSRMTGPRANTICPPMPVQITLFLRNTPSQTASALPESMSSGTQNISKKTAD